MPFDTPAGPAILVANLVTAVDAADRLGVHRTTFYAWVRNEPDFPDQVCPRRWDYTDIYEWFQDWATRHAQHYPEVMSV